MKKRLQAIMLSLLTGGGVAIYNYTGSDYDLLETKTLPSHISKSYKKRSLEEPKYITWHHTAGSKTETLESIAKGQIERGFAGIAYHFAIYENGSIYVLNDVSDTTWHDSGNNHNSIGIVMVGNYELYKLSEAQLYSAQLLVNAIKENVCIKGVRAHRDTSPTLCNGEYAYNQLKFLYY